MSAPTLLVATGNRGKLREIQAILGDLSPAWCTLQDFPDLALPEEGDDYTGNAREKALAAARASGHPTVADDSGLEVRGLAGRPGPHSARYGGPGLDDAGRVAHLLEEMRGLEGDARAARFVCVAALAMPDGRVFTAEGVCTGRILPGPRGEGGFGYDPVFWSDELRAPMAELSEAEKNRISHRARAFLALRPRIRAALRGDASPARPD